MKSNSSVIACLAFSLSSALMSAPASAQADEEFVVSGEVASRVGERNMINAATAQRIAEACERMAEERGMGAAIVILDNFGNIVHAHRMDAAAGYVSMYTAELKAQTAMRVRGPSKVRMNNVVRNPEREAREWNLGFFPNAGGLPVWVDDQIIGFMGVGGMVPRPPQWSDEICAHKALEEVIGPQPPLLEDITGN